ncbi:MAG TPA: hypothetical protein VMA97_05525 [Streptosporangiaceae bacterium]|nr:hypothetical protein [Streptosporangiaceae bacterium]
MAKLLGHGRELVDEILDVLERFLRSQRSCVMAIAATADSAGHGDVIGT